MAKTNSSNQDYTNNADGWDLSGGTTKRKLTITGADITLTGAGSNTYTYPASSDTLVGRASTDTLTNKTLDTAGTGNALKINGTTVSDKTGSGKVVLDTSPTLVTPALGTPSALTLTNATGLPIAGLTASTSTAIGVGSIELGHASDTTISRASAGVIAVEGTNVLMSGGALGTPSSGTLTNATGLPIAGLTASTTTAIGVGSVELGHASDTTLSRSAAGQLAVEGVDVITTSNTKTMTNKTLTTPAITTPAITGAGTVDVLKPNINTVSVSTNAGTCSAAFYVNNFTNSSAANMTITISTSGAVDGQPIIVRIIDASAVAKTITWVNTENSSITTPTTSNGSTTLPLTVAFQYNSGTSKWRCVGYA